MYFETSIIRNNKIIAEFDLTDTDIQTIMDLCKNEEEKRLLGELKKGDMIDILLHFSVYIKRENKV